MSGRLQFASALAVATGLLALPAAGRAQALARAVRVTADNDYFNFWLPPGQRPDDNYTQGARVTWDAAGAPAVARRLLCRAARACGSTLEVGQEMYTPTVDAPTPLAGERPYAGWLYGRAMAVGADPRMRRSAGVTIGVTGAPSLAGPAQETFHRLIPGFRRPLGWAHQLPTELAFALRAEQAWRVAASGSAGRHADLVPGVDATAGTLRTAFGAGARARIGTGLAHPWLAPDFPDRAALYLVVGARGEAVARDLFLDGSTFRGSPRVERTRLVGEWERGMGAHVGRLALEYRAVTRGREYTTGPQSHTYGAISVGWIVR
jgi:lipid A 3-O-deacylase